MITRQTNQHIETETNRPAAPDASDAHAHWSRVRWYADAFRADRRNDVQPAVTSSAAHIDFFGIFLHRALAGRGELESRA